MIKVSFTFLLFLLCENAHAQTYAFTHGRWLINGRFREQTMYAVDGNFSVNRPAHIDSSIDLEKKYCIPPFGDAHTHNLDGGFRLAEVAKDYLRDGVMYVQVLGNYGSGAALARPVLAKTPLEVTYANGLLTGTYGHGFYPYEPLAMGIYIPRDQMRFADSIKKSRTAENNAYFFLDDTAAVDAKWPLIMRYKPDHIKICLLYASDYETRRKAEVPDSYGLSPAVAAYVVKKAHAAGLRVFSHVETADDARLCAAIGVDVLAHLPGYFWDGKPETKDRFTITHKDVQSFQKANLQVIPTMNIQHADEYDKDLQVIHHPDRLAAIRSYEKNILNDLYRSGIKIGLGADYFGKTVSVEIDSLISNEIFSHQILLDIYCRQTPQMIFPTRKIGEIKAGYEASFLVLNSDPLKDIRVIRTGIAARYKRGRFVRIPQ